MESAAQVLQTLSQTNPHLPLTQPKPSIRSIFQTEKFREEYLETLKDLEEFRHLSTAKIDIR
jgi:hypothetical protein